MRLVLPFLLATLTTAAAQTQLPAPTTTDPRLTCPTPQPCKVIILTSEEESALAGTVTLQDNPPRAIPGILATAEQGRPLDLTGIVRYFRDKIANAPRGISPPAQPAEQK